MFDSLPPLLRSILSAALIGLGGALLAYLVYVSFARLTKKDAGRYFGSLFALLIILGTLKWMLDVADAVGLIVILGTALTGALTLGMDDVARDVVSGAKLFATRPFQVGDTVAIAGHYGQVSGSSLTNTVLRGEDGHQIIVRNSEVVAGTIMNYSTGQGEQKLEVQVSIPASQDLERAVASILEGTQDFASRTGAKVGVLCESVNDGRMALKVSAVTQGCDDLNGEKTRLMVATLRALKNNSVSL